MPELLSTYLSNQGFILLPTTVEPEYHQVISKNTLSQ